jgi:Domain of unknown function (DUF4105)
MTSRVKTSPVNLPVNLPLYVLGWLLPLCLLGCSTPLAKGLNENSLVGYLKSGRSELTPEELTLKRWRADLMILPYVEFEDETITIRNVRNCRYRSESDYDVRHYDLRFRLSDVRSIDFIIVPFKESALLAHTMLSFGLADGRHFVVSVEARLEQDQDYSAVAGAGRRFPLTYLVADERDMILLRTLVRDVDVYLYPGRAEPQQIQDLLVDMLARVNKLHRQPEYYDSLTNNCTTNLVDHVNKLRPGRIPSDWRVLLPGHSDRLAYELGLLEIQGTFEYARSLSQINQLAQMHADDPEFSKRIRRQ